MSQILMGIVGGYVVATVAESLQHRLFGHTPYCLRKAWRYFPKHLEWFRLVWWSHTLVHHFAAAGNRFTSPITPSPEALGPMTQQQRNIVTGNHFGLTTKWSDVIWFMWLPLTTVPLFWATLGEQAAIAAIVPMLFPPLFSKFVHRHIHSPYDVAIRESGLPTRWLLRTRYGRAMIRHHWMHHRYAGSNFNLLLGGDWILGVGRRPTNNDIREMSEQGITLD
ncbi:MAG: hypothetical protein NT069_35820 [Planctomycetota bacterium]|nr:hypothetical protein [Planctomycetota bacterium]